MKKVNIGIIGCGTVGSGVIEVLRKRGDLIARRTGLDIAIRRICDTNPRALRNVRIGKALLTSNADYVLQDPEVDIVVELIGGMRAAKTVITRAIKAEKHVVTANKALLAVHGQEIFKRADKNGMLVRFGASVGGGIPIIRALREGFVSNRIDAIYGIINGTSNFILTKMAQAHDDFDAALAEAEQRGFAERNPSLDINGKDSAHKLALLALFGFKYPVDFDDIYVEGIQAIEPSDIEYAKELGYTIKLLAIAKRVGRYLEVRVHPTLLPNEHVLSGIEGVYNAILVRGDLVGDSLFYGEGAGKYPTASAVISDIVDIGYRLQGGAKDHILVTDTKDKIVSTKKFGEVRTRYYIRFSAIDRPGVLAKVSGILARHEISIASVTQKERRKAHVVPIVMMTHEAVEADMQKALSQIDKLDVIKSASVRIRVESE
jgi:homoserine dehydrogenase